jgi:hypothetical protein
MTMEISQDDTYLSYVSAEQQSGPLSHLEILAELSPPERETALRIIRQRKELDKLDHDWLAAFLQVLKAHSAEEKQSTTKIMPILSGLRRKA